MTQDTVVESETPPGNPASMVSVISGIMLCIPGLGLIAIPAGIWGLRRAKVVGVGQRAATFGLVLGIINLAWWAALLFGALGQWHTYQKAKPAIESQKQFIVLIGSGNLTSAKAMCGGSIDDEKLTDTIEQFQKWGILHTVNPYYSGDLHSNDDVEVQSELKFESVDKILTGHWSIAGAAPELNSYEFKDAPTTQPAATQSAAK